MNRAFGMEHVGQAIEPGIGHASHGQMGIDTALSGEHPGTGDDVEKGRLAGELHPYDTDLHFCLPWNKIWVR